MKRVRGRVLAVDKGKATIITPAGEFLEVPVNSPVCIGSEICVDIGQDKKLSLSRFGTFAAAAVIALFVLTQSVLPGLAAPAYYMHIDINPSVELGVSETHRVLSARGLNEDGSRLLLGTKVEKQPVDKAMEAIIRRAEELSFLTAEKENTVMVSVLAEKPAAQAELEAVADDVLNDLALTLEEDHIPGTAAVATAGKEIRERASEKKISANKVLMGQTGERDTGKPESIRQNLEKAFEVKEVNQERKQDNNTSPGKGPKNAGSGQENAAPGQGKTNPQTRSENNEKQFGQTRSPEKGGAGSLPPQKVESGKQNGSTDRGSFEESDTGSSTKVVPGSPQPPGLDKKQNNDNDDTDEDIREQREGNTGPGKQRTPPGHLRSDAWQSVPYDREEKKNK